MVISAIGGCLFLCGFFVEGVNGFGRGLGLLGIGIVLCGIATNLLLQSSSAELDPPHKRHLMVQLLFTVLLAVALFSLAGYLFRYGHLPKFMPGRYDEPYHVKRLTNARKPTVMGPISDDLLADNDPRLNSAS